MMTFTPWSKPLKRYVSGASSLATETEAAWGHIHALSVGSTVVVPLASNQVTPVRFRPDAPNINILALMITGADMSESKIHKVEAAPNQRVIDMLEDLLNDARNGEIQGIAIAGSMSNARTFNCFEPGGNAMAMVGEVHILARDLIDEYIDIRRKPAPEFCE